MNQQQSDDGVWEGQSAMGDRLVAQARGQSPVRAQPLEDRVMLFPVVPDEKRPVDIHLVQLGGKDLPDMGVVVEVGWKVNAEAVAELRRIMALENKTPLDYAIQRAIEDADILSIGDIVAFNQFSGMDVQGTNFVVCSKQDCLVKLRNLPVRLKGDQERWDAVEQARQEGELADVRESLVGPKPEIVRARR